MSRGFVVADIKSRPLRMVCAWIFAIPAVLMLIVLPLIYALVTAAIEGWSGFKAGWHELWDGKTIKNIWHLMMGGN